VASRSATDERERRRVRRGDVAHRRGRVESPRMLTELRIRQLAVIDEVALTLAPGFNVLTGETGAGKSIIVEALGLLIGERASSDLVRACAERATVEGVFDVSDRSALRVSRLMWPKHPLP